MYTAFHGFGQAKFYYGGLVLGSSLFSLLPQLPQKMTITSKVVKVDSKIIILIKIRDTLCRIWFLSNYVVFFMSLPE